jgi:hypothetical protein
MEQILRTFEQNRKNVITLLQNHSLDQLNVIPTGFNNNIIWNAGHLLVAQQFVLYHFSNLPMPDFVQQLAPKYGSGTRPDGNAGQAELDLIIDELRLSTQQVINDFNDGLFRTYQSYTSEYFNITMNNIEEAIHFDTYHEAFHFGFMNAIKTCIAKASWLALQ